MAFNNPTSSSSPFGTMDSELPGENEGEFFGSALALDSDALISDEFNSLPHPCDPSSGSKIGVSQSPDSTLPDSSSDSSLQRPRHGSSDSSHSGFLGGDVTMVDEEQVAAWSAMDNMTGSFSRNVKIPKTNATFSDNVMDKVFDFDSAASSPGPYNTTSDAVFKSSHNFANMPYRSSSGSFFVPTTSAGHRSARSADVDDKSQLSSAKSHQNPSLTPIAQRKSTALKDEREAQAKTLDHNHNSQWAFGKSLATHFNFVGASSKVRHAVTNVPIPPSIDTSTMPEAPLTTPTLFVQTVTQKSRVETQIPVQLTLSPMPPGVTKLHISRHTVARPKQVAKTSVEKSAEMLELSVELVCTSAMQDPAKRSRAFARAAYIHENERKEENRRLSSGVVPPYASDDPEKPSNGGCILICNSCKKREERRAARKKPKPNTSEEEALWEPHSGKRIIMFNSQEVKEWEYPNATHADLKKKDKGSKPLCEDITLQANRSASSSKGSVSLPMRIGCYCRHQEEKIGFQVIFTIKDHEGNCIAQALSNSIMITDDHKTHTGPASKASQSSVHGESPKLSGDAGFPQEPSASAPVRNAYSATDLQGLRQTFNHRLPHGNVPHNMPQNGFHTPSAMVTHPNLSRPVSPSAPSERHQKRRKGSGSVNLPSGLIMTKLNAENATRNPISDLTSAAPSNTVSPAAATFSPVMYTPFQPRMDFAQNMPPSGYIGGPSIDLSTPGTGSQTMEDLTGLQQQTNNFNQAPVDHQSGHAAIHAAGHASNSSQNSASFMSQPQNHIFPVVQNFLGDQTISAALPTPVSTPQPSPTIHKLIPSEGSKSGGIEVTCLGSGFHPGLQVMFGETLATTTTYWGETSLVCLLPPASLPGPVTVRFMHNYAYIDPRPSRQQSYFTYLDDEDREVIKDMLTTIVNKITGRMENTGEIMRKMRSGTLFGPDPQGGYGMANGNSMVAHAAVQHMKASDPNSGVVDPGDLETWLLRCLDLIDLDDSPFPAHLNITGHNGQTMLHLGASLGFYRFVSALLARGAHPDLRDKNGMSPMHLASLNNRSQIVRKLRSAGGDPTLRSLRGYTPAEMASTKEMSYLIDALERSSWSQSARATPNSRKSRSSSCASLYSLRDRSMSESVAFDSFSPDESDVAVSSDDGAPSSVSHIGGPSKLWVCSRRNSTTEEKIFLKDRTSDDPAGNDRFLAAATAWSAWRDQIATQVQQLQQSMHRTLPNLPMPTLPPMPNLPDYQDYPMMRRISSLVPQRYPLFAQRDSKDNDYHWWELLRGTTSPPPYEELYPLDITKDFVHGSSGNAVVNENSSTGFKHKCSGNSSIIEKFGIGGSSLTVQQREELVTAHAMKVRRLQNDRHLFFLWIPLSLLVLMAMFNPQLWHGIYRVFVYFQDAHQRRAAVEV